jgi:hypothetical protein
VVQGRLEYWPPYANGLKHLHLPKRPGDEDESLVSDQRLHKRAPTIPTLSQSATQQS